MDDSLSAAAFQLVHDALNPQLARRRSRATEKAVAMKAIIDSAIMALPVLVRADVKAHGEELCSVCYFSYDQKFEDEEKAKKEAPEEAAEERVLGVTKVDGCGHLFCRECLVEWIQSYHGTCPKCRHLFLEIKPITDSDDESSDGGEYIPQDDDDEEEEESVLNTDGLTEADEDEGHPIMEVDVEFERALEELSNAGEDHSFGPTDYTYGQRDDSHSGFRHGLFEHGRDYEEQLRREASASYVAFLNDGDRPPRLGSESEVVTAGLPTLNEGEAESSGSGRRRMIHLLSGVSDTDEEEGDELHGDGPSTVDDDMDVSMDVREFMQHEWEDDDPDDMDYEDSSECGLTDDASSEADGSAMSESGMTMVDEEELKEEAEYFVRAGSVPDSDFDIPDERAYRYARDKEADS
ncbi:hypothetical protein CVT24_001775 [Panaeolus cyanescens]|uniref:RING-type domain-containing protein n=1 Tax=Panaeolus cyanescens TaxID=181874 RepID=A0A409YUA1_9AGAR|nr:hypothetical protein CVT24_001775 [Panaeolus cyanescens]